MASSETEPAKLLLPYLQRADELQKHEPLVAYYCRLYAMERGMKIPNSERTKTTNTLLLSLMNQLEKDRKTTKLGPEDNLYVEGFALNVFGKADKQDQAGRADLNTAKTFYAASIFFEILNQFGELEPDLEQKQKYAVWKAADIRKAMKEGRKPTPGPPSGDNDMSIPSNAVSNTHDLGTGGTSDTSPGQESDPSNDYHDPVSYQHLPNVHPASDFHDTDDNKHSTNSPPPMQFHDTVSSNLNSSNISTSSPPYPSTGYPSQDYYHPPPSQDYHPPPPQGYHPSSSQDFLPTPPSQDYNSPPPARSEGPYSPSYDHQHYSSDSQHLAPNYLPHETPSYPLPHFQSYPSFSESSLPSVPSNYIYQGSDTASYSSQSAPLTTNHSPSTHLNSLSRNGSVSEPKSTTQTYQYDSNYQPLPEKIAEAHKAARFAVGALAFDDVSTGVDFLRKALELLTNPSSGENK